MGKYYELDPRDKLPPMRRMTFSDPNLEIFSFDKFHPNTQRMIKHNHDIYDAYLDGRVLRKLSPMGPKSRPFEEYAPSTQVIIRRHFYRYRQFFSNQKQDSCFSLVRIEQSNGGNPVLQAIPGMIVSGAIYAGISFAIRSLFESRRERFDLAEFQRDQERQDQRLREIIMAQAIERERQRSQAMAIEMVRTLNTLYIRQQDELQRERERYDDLVNRVFTILTNRIEQLEERDQ